MYQQNPQILAKIHIHGIDAEIASQIHPSPMNAIYREPLHTIALQQTPRQRFSVGRFCVDGRQENFREIGRVLMMPATIPLEVQASGGLSEYVRCQFTQETLDSYGADVDLYDERVLAGCLNIRHARFANILAQLSQELRSPGLASAAMIEALGATLIIAFARHLSDRATQSSLYRGGLSRQQFRKITEYIETAQNCPTLSDLSQLTGLSLRHLTRSFKQTTGETVYSYIEQVRLQRAQALLARSDVLIKEIAYRLGFSCSSSFSVAFRKIAGETPQAYRARTRARRIIASGSETRN
jgi:AraC family transcriptional regulator